MIPIRVQPAERDEFRDDILSSSNAKSMPAITSVTMPVFWGEAMYKG